MDAALEKSGREVEDRSARFSGNQLLSKADNYLFVGILARFFFFLQACNSDRKTIRLERVQSRTTCMRKRRQRCCGALERC